MHFLGSLLEKTKPVSYATNSHLANAFCSSHNVTQITVYQFNEEICIMNVSAKCLLSVGFIYFPSNIPSWQLQHGYGDALATQSTSLTFGEIAGSSWLNIENA